MSKLRKLDLYPIEPALLETTCILIGELQWEETDDGSHPTMNLYLSDYDITIPDPKIFYRCECADIATTKDIDPYLVYNLYCGLDEDKRFVYILFEPTEQYPNPSVENTTILGYDGGIPLPCFSCGEGGYNCTYDCKTSTCDVAPGESLVAMSNGCPPFTWVINQTPMTLLEYGNYGFAEFYTSGRSNTLIMDIQNFAVQILQVSSTVTDKYGRTAGCNYRARCNTDMSIVALEGSFEIEPGNCKWFGSNNSKKYVWNLGEGGGFYFDSTYHLYDHNPVADSVHICADPGVTYCNDDGAEQDLEMTCLLDEVPRTVSELVETTTPEDIAIVYVTTHMNCAESQTFTVTDGRKWNWRITNVATGESTYVYSSSSYTYTAPVCGSAACYDIADSCEGTVEIAIFCDDEGTIEDSVSLTINCITDPTDVAYYKIGSSVGCGIYGIGCDSSVDCCVFICPVGNIRWYQQWWWSSYNCSGEMIVHRLVGDQNKYHNCSLGCTPETWCSGGDCYGPGDMIDKRSDCNPASYPKGCVIVCDPGSDASIAQGCCPEDLM